MLFYHRSTLYEMIIGPLAPELISHTPLFGSRKNTINKSILFDQHSMIDSSCGILQKGDSDLTVIGIEVQKSIIFHLVKLVFFGKIALHFLTTPPSTSRRAYQRFTIVDNGTVLVRSNI